jgi:hypothetical protein
LVCPMSKDNVKLLCKMEEVQNEDKFYFVFKYLLGNSWGLSLAFLPNV